MVKIYFESFAFVVVLTIRMEWRLTNLKYIRKFDHEPSTVSGIWWFVPPIVGVTVFRMETTHCSGFSCTTEHIFETCWIRSAVLPIILGENRFKDAESKCESTFQASEPWIEALLRFTARERRVHTAVSSCRWTFYAHTHVRTHSQCICIKHRGMTRHTG